MSCKIFFVFSVLYSNFFFLFEEYFEKKFSSFVKFLFSTSSILAIDTSTSSVIVLVFFILNFSLPIKFIKSFSLTPLPIPIS